MNSEYINHYQSDINTVPLLPRRLTCLTSTIQAAIPKSYSERYASVCSPFWFLLRKCEEKQQWWWKLNLWDPEPTLLAGEICIGVRGVFPRRGVLVWEGLSLLEDFLLRRGLVSDRASFCSGSTSDLTFFCVSNGIAHATGLCITGWSCEVFSSSTSCFRITISTVHITVYENFLSVTNLSFTVLPL